MKKKLLILTLSILALTGCTNLSNASLDEITNTMLSSKSSLANTVFDGYKYYVPRGLRLVMKNDYNASFLDEYNNTYYLYIDIISYYNKEKLDYKDRKSVV